MGRVIVKAIISLLLFVAISGVISYYHQSLEIKTICLTLGLPNLILTLIFFPYSQAKKLQIIFLLISPGLFWAFHLITIFSIGNMYQLFPNFIVLAIIIGFLMVNKIKKVYLPILVFSIALIGSFMTIDQLLKVNINDFIVDKDFHFKQDIGASDIKIIEFWYSSCSSCISNFDKFQEFYDANKNIYDIRSVNIEIKRDRETDFEPKEFVKSRGFSFPVIEMDQNTAVDSYSITSTPSTMVIKNNRIIFHENIIVSERLLKDILEKVK